MDCGKARQCGFMSRTFSSVLIFVDLVKYNLFGQQRPKSAFFCWIIALRAQLLLTMIAIQVEWRKIFQRWFLSWGTFVTTSKHFGRKDCILKRVDEFYSRLFMVRTSSPWKGEDGHDWNMIMSATALKREDTYIHTYVRVTRHGKPHKRRNSGTPLSRCSPSQGVWPGLYYAGMHPDGKQGGIYVGNTVG